MNTEQLYEYSVSGNVEYVTKCIDDGCNVYSRTMENETPFWFAIINGHTEVANILWNIYERDLQFIECSLNCDDKFWMNSPILIGFGCENVATCEKLYSEYLSYECDCAIDKTKCVVVLLKHDNCTCSKVLCLSPKTEKGRLLALAIIKCVIWNGVLDLNAVTSNHLSLFHATAQSGLIDIFDKLLNYGAKVNKLEIVRSALEFGQIHILKQLKNMFRFNMYDLLMSQDYYTYIFITDNWAIFKYAVEQIVAETQLTWCDIINLVLPCHYKPLTVFQYAVCHNCVQIAENCLTYGPSVSNCYVFQQSLLECSEILSLEQSQNLLLKIIEIDPKQLEIILDVPDDGGANNQCHRIGFFHKIVNKSSIQSVNEIFKKYPFVRRFFFNNIEFGLSTIKSLFETAEQREKIKCVLANCFDQLDADTFNEIVSQIAGSKGDDFELFSYVISLRDCDFTCSAMRNTIPDVVRKCNYHILDLILSKVNYDLSEIRIWDKYNLLIFIHYPTAKSTAKSLKSSSKLFDKLVRSGVSFNIINSEGRNLLHQSVATNNIYKIKKLLELGIDLNLHDQTGKLPIHYATSVAMLDLLNTWTSKSYLNVAIKQTRKSLLHIAVADNNRDLIKYILDNGGNVNAVDDDGRSPIFNVHDVAAAELLLKYEPNLNVLDNNGDSPLIYFITPRTNHSHNHAIVNLLYQNEIKAENSKFKIQLEMKCNQNFRYTPFLIKVIDMCSECTKILLQLTNIDFFICGLTESTALHVAAAKHYFDLFDEFIEKGLPINAVDYVGCTPLLAYCMSRPTITYEGIMQILKYSPNVNIKSKGRQISAIFSAAENTNVGAIICELLLSGANIMDTDILGKTAYSELSSELQKLFKFLT